MLHNDSVTPDTAFRVDMAVETYKYTNPKLVVPAPGVANYYRGRTAVEQVPAFRRGVYKNIVDKIDLHLYGSSGGPRMAFVVRPGGDPQNIKLVFTGQDSLGIDWQGALKIYMQGRWIELKQAIAYQVHADGSMTDVNWTAAYELGQGNAVAYFTFGTYDHTLPLVLQIGYGPMNGAGTLDARNLGWSTFMGGMGGDELTCVETDTEGNPYSCGHTWAPDFPVHPGNSQFDPAIGEFSGNDDAVIMKFNAGTKQLVWATYYAGSVPAVAGSYAKTEAQKLALGTTTPYVFAVGTTNCMDFMPWRTAGVPFGNAVHEAYLGGQHRMWLGAFSTYNGVRDWATTHGQGSGYTWKEEGLSIAVAPNGSIAVGGRLVGFNPDFQSVTLAGAFNRSTGGAFVLLFEPLNYTIRWASAFGAIRSPVNHPIPR